MTYLVEVPTGDGATVSVSVREVDVVIASVAAEANFAVTLNWTNKR